ncbi:tRNA 2-selenouridine(34) synthase MnmH [Cognatishimia sp. F0-27]|uniref:tRNA 2-selenouridine(34) synthase MnmH n=1 Tax=Cognatishimia sp. F0-27 TaxID=2816855 RepID=UPI001D0C43FB|nr:tRNA 2-selenouridine(34) synthase MnmH [Cognatishimia sp. F0-27]MCC1493827.1 tRNA 2-selenouridine(34) synthase MnmH [Cognatishimia sp. F0-27]
MTAPTPSLKQFFDHGYDAVIDVRSPAEYAEDHVPGAINLPVLTDAERAEVGTLYKQVSPFKARKLGAALVFRNAAHHVETALAEFDGGWRPLVYCWRGGQRSGSFAWMLREIGWRAETVPGGYRTFRRLVSQALYETPLDHRMVQLGGFTGTAKTALLPRLAALGVQVLDLEGLARHRGSLLGHLPGGQPSQKAFETALIAALHGLDPARPVLVEAESSRIGARILPPSVWDAMKTAPWIEITAPLDARAHYLAETYADILEDGPALKDTLDNLRRYRGHALVDQWHELIDEGRRVSLCASLAADHYDPAYVKSRQSSAQNVVATHHAAALDDSALDKLAETLAAEIHAISS